MADSIEERLSRDEARLTADEARLEAEESEVRESRVIAWSSLLLLATLAAAIFALVLSLVAVRNDMDSLSSHASDDSVATSSLRDGAVTGAKLAPGAGGPSS